MSLSAAVKIEPTAYAGWPHCYRITNGEVELIVTADVGPRVIRYGFVGGQNLFKEYKEQLGHSGEKEWLARGGHRLWMGPEVRPDTYALDNGPVQIEVKDGVLTATQPVEPETGLQKQISIRLAATGSQVEVIHRLKNTGKPREIAPWALTMMAQGGLGITGFPPRGSHDTELAPTNPLVMWAYTNLADPRWRYTSKYLMLQQDPNNKGTQKLGHFNHKTWGAYLLNGELFVKQALADPKAKYPDFNCSFETFTNDEFLEIETLGPLTRLPTGATVDHLERWSLYRGVKLSSYTDAELDNVLLPILK